MRRVPLLAIALAAACAPQNAKIEQGDFTAFLAATNSPTLGKGKLDLEGFKDTEGFQRRDSIDCRNFETAKNKAENNKLRLEDRALICADDKQQSPHWPPSHEIWLEDNGFYVVGGKLDPWRGEAFVSSEGDVQIGFHQRLPGGEDFRFAFVVDPNFQPTQCVQNASGNVEALPIDGDWIGEWSKSAADGSQLFMLNAGAFQFDPLDTQNQWNFPDKFEAGFAAGKFADDAFISRASLFGDPATYLDPIDPLSGQVNVTESDLLWCEFDGGEDPTKSSCMQAQVTRANDLADGIQAELEAFGVPAAAGDMPSVRPRVEDNLWRTPDGKSAGLDGWVELDYSWVEFDKGSDLTVGGAASGTFNLMLDATDSNSRFYVRGRFSVDRFKKDNWTTKYLPAIKAEQNNAIVCGKPTNASEE